MPEGAWWEQRVCAIAVQDSVFFWELLLPGLGGNKPTSLPRGELSPEKLVGKKRKYLEHKVIAQDSIKAEKTKTTHFRGSKERTWVSPPRSVHSAFLLTQLQSTGSRGRRGD